MGSASAIKCVEACVVALPNANDICIIHSPKGAWQAGRRAGRKAGRQLFLQVYNSMSSPSSLCAGIHRPWEAEGVTRNGSNLDASMQILFSTLRHLEKSTRNPRGFLIPYHVASDGLGICFAFLVCFMRPFHIYLLLFPSVSRVCVCCFPRPSPNSRSDSRSYSCSCCCA